MLLINLISLIGCNRDVDPDNTPVVDSSICYEDDDCGDKRCGGFGDFIDIEIDDEGRPWIALAHNPAGEIGIVGTLIQGPTLYGDLKQLTPLMPGGRDTLP